jgi:two-component system OmpR family sensor kinase
VRVANAGPVVPQEKLQNLTARFERAGPNTTGSGLGLAIVAAICDRIGTALVLSSPREGKEDGFEVCIRLPISPPSGR